jgi:phytoene dehydrogenase-like protein
LLEPGVLPDAYRDAYARPEASTSAYRVQLGVNFIPDMSPLTFCREEDGLGVAVAIPSLADPTRAPEGHACVELLAFVPSEQAGEWDRSAEDYEDKKRRMGDRLIARAERVIPGPGEGIVFREDSSPATFERYVWTEKGSIYGPALNARRPPMKTPVRGLMLAGSGVFPGAGVEAVVISGGLAAEAVMAGGAGGKGGG